MPVMSSVNSSKHFQFAKNKTYKKCVTIFSEPELTFKVLKNIFETRIVFKHFLKYFLNKD